MYWHQQSSGIYAVFYYYICYIITYTDKVILYTYIYIECIMCTLKLHLAQYLLQEGMPTNYTSHSV